MITYQIKRCSDIKKAVLIISVVCAVIVISGLAVLLTQCNSEDISSSEKYSDAGDFDSSDKNETSVDSAANDNKSGENSSVGEQYFDTNDFEDSHTSDGSLDSDISDSINIYDEAEENSSDWTSLYPATPID